MIKGRKLPRVAILFFGLPRCSTLCIPSIEKNAIEVVHRFAGEGNVKLFHHLYRQDRVTNSRSNENGTLDQENYAWFESKMGVIEPPNLPMINAMLEPILAFGDAYEDSGNSLKNLLMQLNSLSQVTSFVKGGDFDVVIFLRPDLEYHDPLPVQAIRFAATHPNACVVPNWQTWGGCNDRFAICGKYAALQYGNRLDDAINYCQSKQQPLHAEKLVKFIARKHRLQLRTMGTRASRIRVDSTRKEEVFNIFRSSPDGFLRKARLVYLELISRAM